MSLARLWAVLAILLPVLAALIANLSSVDLAYQLRAGAIVLDGGGIPRTDTFTFTAAGLPWVDQQWGAQVILAAVYRLGGWTGLVLLRALLVGLLFGLIFLACRLRGADLRRAAWLTLAAFFVAAVALALRPQLFGMVLLAATLAIVAARRRRPNLVWVVPLIVLAWANIHGSFFLGPVVLGLAWLEDLRDRAPSPHRLLLVAVAAVGAAFVNPFGAEVWSYAVGLSTNAQVTARITEWQPTTLRTIPGMLFFGSALAVATFLARRGRPTSWATLAWLAVFFIVGAYAIRGVAWWPLGAAFAVAGLLGEATQTATAPVERATPAGTARLNAIVVGALVLAGGVLLPIWRTVDPGLGAPAGVVGSAPPGITAQLRSLGRPGDHLFNPQQWGSWFEFALPAVPVAIDARIELFPAKTWDEYEAVVAGAEGWQGILDGWGVSVVVAAKADDAFANRLAAAGWRRVHADDDGSIFVRGDRG
jgi:hypothetical protein